MGFLFYFEAPLHYYLCKLIAVCINIDTSRGALKGIKFPVFVLGRTSGLSKAVPRRQNLGESLTAILLSHCLSNDLFQLQCKT
jgi:hypothetical protein